MALAFTNAAACASFVTDQIGLEPDDLTTLLEVSAGKDKDDAKVYRPYIVAALILGRVAHDDKLLKAKGGVTFDDPKATIAGWRAMQVSTDAFYGLTVPPGFEASAPSGSGGTTARSGSVPISFGY